MTASCLSRSVLKNERIDLPKKQQSLFLKQQHYSVTMSLKFTESLLHISQEENVGKVSIKICIFAQLLEEWLNAYKLTD